MLLSPRTVLAVLVFSVGALLVSPGCSRQGEGERCEVANGNDDCDSGLTCIDGGQLLSAGADRCCPEAGSETNERCRRKGAGPSPGTGGTGTAGTGGSPAAGGTASEAGAAGEPASTGGTSAGAGGTSAGAGGTTAGGGAAAASAGEGGSS